MKLLEGLRTRGQTMVQRRDSQRRTARWIIGPLATIGLVVFGYNPFLRAIGQVLSVDLLTAQ